MQQEKLQKVSTSESRTSRKRLHSPSGDVLNLRIPATDRSSVSKDVFSCSLLTTDQPPPRAALICDHMERWKIRQKWKESSNRNQLRYSESIKILKEMKEMYNH
ncbi:hypothetical protein CRUP_003683 [Coryphaenoides rupestris]|nr:hypothetical protein CRUP_003683 [Coryphaenoides rupestris]